MLAVFKRDLRSYFTSPLGYVFIAAFLAVLNAYFYINNILRASSDIASLFGFIHFVLIFTTPILTMRLFSEEFKQRTDQMLFITQFRFWNSFWKFISALAVLLLLSYSRFFTL